MLSRRTLMAAPALFAAAPAKAQQSWYPLMGADGRPVTNFRISGELGNAVERLPNLFERRGASPDVTLVEVYDLNCPWCRQAAADVEHLASNDPDLRVQYLNAPALGLPSFLAARVEYAVKRVAGNDAVLAFHHAFMRQRGVLDGTKAMAVAESLKLDRAAIEREANSDAAGEALRMAAKLAQALNLLATPSWLISGVAIVGYPGRQALADIVQNVRRCDKPVCSG